MNSLEVNLHRAIKVCEGYYCKEFEKLYTFTTENISGSLEYFDLKDKKFFTVGSSFDQCLNAYYYGARDITLYDINPNSKYHAYFKIAAILCLDYTEFQEFYFIHGIKEYFNSKMFCKELFNKIKYTLRLLNYESFLFFDELFCNFDSKTIRQNIFDDDEYRNDAIKGFNIYLKSEENYNKLKSILKGICFKFICGDIFKNKIEGKYDNVMLSNLCTTTTVDNLKQLIEKIDMNNLNSGGSILLAYLWDIDFNETKYEKDWKEIYNMVTTKEKLKEYISEYHQINSGRDFIWNEDRKKDLILIYRKNSYVCKQKNI